MKKLWDLCWTTFLPYYIITSVENINAPGEYRFIAIFYLHPPFILKFLLKPMKRQAVSRERIIWYTTGSFKQLVFMSGCLEKYCRKQKYEKQIMDKLAS